MNTLKYSKSENYLDYEESMQKELESLSEMFNLGLNRLMFSPTTRKEDEVEGQYLIQLQEISKGLSKDNILNEEALQDLIQLRCQLDSIKCGFEGSNNLKFQLEKLLIICNAKLKEHKKKRKKDFEVMRNSIWGGDHYKSKFVIFK